MRSYVQSNELFLCYTTHSRQICVTLDIPWKIGRLLHYRGCVNAYPVALHVINSGGIIGMWCCPMPALFLRDCCCCLFLFWYKLYCNYELLRADKITIHWSKAHRFWQTRICWSWYRRVRATEHHSSNAALIVWFRNRRKKRSARRSFRCCVCTEVRHSANAALRARCSMRRENLLSSCLWRLFSFTLLAQVLNTYSTSTFIHLTFVCVVHTIAGSVDVAAALLLQAWHCSQTYILSATALFLSINIKLTWGD